MSEERKTLDQRAQMTDLLERLRHSALTCFGNGDSKNLAGSTVRCGPTCGERLLLRCGSSPPHLTR